MDAFKKAKADGEAELANVKLLLVRSQEALIQSGTDTKTALERLATEQAAHQRTQQELARAIQKAHDFELEMVQCRTRLDEQSGRVKN